MQKRLERIHPYTGDPTHRGSGEGSIQIGDSANAGSTYSVAFGQSAWALGPYGVALGYNTYVDADHSGSSAIGPNSTTTRSDQVSLGAPYGEVYVAGGLVLEPADALGPQPFHPGDPDAPAGAFAVDDDYIYVDTSTGWRRAALSSF